MKIVYSPLYDSDIYLGESPTQIGIHYVGSCGLLQELELRLGMSCDTISDIERATSYLNAIKKHISGYVFEDIFKVDDLGVASKLLSWRDKLVLSGWNCSCDEPDLPKLNILAKIEKDFKCIGYADRWCRICESIDKVPDIKKQISAIQVDCPVNELPFIIYKTVQKLEGNGVIINWQEPKQIVMEPQKYRVVYFEQLRDVYEWIATSNIPSGVVFVNRNNVVLNHVLYTWDKPQVQSNLTDSNPQLLQLFKLGLSIFSRPLNVTNLTSYLQLPISPIPSDLRRSLSKLLIDNGGFGEKVKGDNGKEVDSWNYIIDSYEFINSDGKATAQARNNKLKFLEPIRKDYTLGIPKADLVDYVNAIDKWINGHFAIEGISEALSCQFRELKSQLSGFLLAINELSDTIQQTDIENIAKRIYQPMNYHLQHIEAGSMQVVSDVRSIIESPKTIVWLDCQEDDIETDEYDFLSNEEKAYLKANEVRIPNFQEHLKTKRSERLRYLAKANEIVLVQSAYDGMVRLGEHPLISELRFAYKTTSKSSDTDLPFADKSDIFRAMAIHCKTAAIEKIEPVKYVELGNIEYNGRKESNHSIDTLINFPFDYVMHYIANLYESGDDQLKNTYITQGLVAHSFVQHVIDDAKSNLSEMRRLTVEDFDRRLSNALDETGLILRLPENATLLEQFIEQLKESTLSLIEIMKRLKLHPLGCEINIPSTDAVLAIPSIGNFGARIDCLLQNDDGDYVIFDFKWSYSKSYEKKLDDNSSIQLELYRQTVLAAYPDKKVAGVGYYLMPKKCLVTTDYPEIKGSKLIKHVDSNSSANDLFQQIQNSYEFRMQEIKAGHIEEYELQDCLNDATCYVNNIEAKGLFSISVDPKYSGRGRNKQITSLIKNSVEIFNTSKQFEPKEKNPSEIATTFQILKGRLK
jgi:hypothetical protein